MNTVFLRAVERDDKGHALRSASGDDRFERGLRLFAAIPGAPFAYWIPTALLKLTASASPFNSPDLGRETRCGLGTLDDFRFLRLAWGVASGNRIWVPYFGGGTSSRYYEDRWQVVRWGEDGRLLKVFVEARVGSASRKVQGESRYFQRGFNFPRRSRSFCPKCMPDGGIFSNAGQAGFLPSESLLSGIAIFGSSICSTLITTVTGGQNEQFEVGQVARTPWPNLTPSDEQALAILARRAWSLKRTLDTRTETSHAFTIPSLLQVEGESLTDRVAAWNERVHAINDELGEIQAEIDDRCFELYGISDEDRRAITEGFGGGEDATSEEDSPDSDEPDPEGPELDEGADPETLAAELLSWAIGVAFGRFDVRLATGSRELPEEPDPFDPLPACSAGMLTGGDGLPLHAAPGSYPTDFPTDGILVDDHGHDRDLLAATRAVIDEVFGEAADGWWERLAATLDPKGHELRNWLASKFFTHHLKAHSKSRRKSPIVWQIATPSKRYSVWLYAHRLSRDSLFQLQAEILTPKLAHEERRLNNMVQDTGGSPSARERKEISHQEDFVAELRAMLDEVKLVAPLWRPELDDGIVLVMAPLWRLVPQHKAWQKELKAKWSELAAGKYDWAHLAMHLWPERVIGKCTEDRSLAIAHDLEDTFWLEDADGKWQGRDTPTRPVAELVAEQRSTAVEAALEGMR